MDSVMQIGDLISDDLDSMKNLQPDDWPDITPIMEYYLETDFCFPLKATIDGHIAGIGTGIVHADVAWLGHIIVHRGHRNKGIGKSVTLALIEQMKNKGIESIYLAATELGEPVYKRVGFETDTEYVFFKDIKPDESWISCPNIFPYKMGYMDQLAHMDLVASGEDRMNHLQPHLNDGFYYMHDEKLCGYYLPTLGDGLIVAINSIAGIELIKLRLKKNAVSIFPIDNTTALEFMSRHNYEPYRKIKRMWLGKKISWQPENMYNRIGGNVG